MPAIDEWLLNNGGLYSKFERTCLSCAHEHYLQSAEHGTRVILFNSVWYFIDFFFFGGGCLLFKKLKQLQCTGINLLSKEGNVLFNDALNTFYSRLYGVRHIVKDHSDGERGKPLPPHGLLFSINSKGSFICTIPQTG